jgi:aryl-alcohol dehydrogenase-like predicted oxidoreductase
VLKGVALTNFNLERLQEIVEPPSSITRRTGFEGVQVVSNQVSFSIIDTRPIDGGMLRWCEKRGISIMAYGVLLGGLLSDDWLGAEEPTPKTEGGEPELELDTPSLERSFGYVLRWGSWEHFQDLLIVLRDIADKHQRQIRKVAAKLGTGYERSSAGSWQHQPQLDAKVSIAHVAIRWVLQQASSSSSKSTVCAILGQRLGHPWGVSEKHARENAVVFAFELDRHDFARIEKVRTAHGTRPLLESMGDCGDEHRVKPEGAGPVTELPDEDGLVSLMDAAEDAVKDGQGKSLGREFAHLSDEELKKMGGWRSGVTK